MLGLVNSDRHVKSVMPIALLLVSLETSPEWTKGPSFYQLLHFKYTSVHPCVKMPHASGVLCEMVIM